MKSPRSQILSLAFRLARRGCNERGCARAADLAATGAWLALVGTGLGLALADPTSSMDSPGLALSFGAIGGGLLWRRREAAERPDDTELLAHDPARAAGDLAALLRRAPGVVVLLDERGRIVEANDRALEFYGYSLDELRRLSPGALEAGGSPSSLAPRLALLESMAGSLFESTHRRQDGTTARVEISSTPCELGGHRYLLECCRDLARRDSQQRSLERLNRLYATLAAINQALIRTDSREQIQQAVCRALVQSQLFKMAWIGWRDATSAAIVPAAVVGDEGGYLEQIGISADDRPEGRGPTGTAIRDGCTCVCNDLLGRTLLQPWHAAAAERGFLASIALPVRVGGEVQGVLSVYAGERDFFGEREIALLEQVTADLSFALDSLEHEARRRGAEARSLLLGAALEGAPNAIVITNRDGLIQWANPAFVRSSGYTLDELVGRTPRLLKSGHQPPGFYAELWRTITRGQNWRGEIVNRRKNGELYLEDITILPVLDAAGEIGHFVSIRQDVTGRKGAERRVRDQAALLDKASEAIVVADLSHRVTFWNRGAERLFGSSAVATLGQPLVQAFALDPDASSSEFQRALAVPQDWRGEINGRNATGQPVVIETSITMLRDDLGVPTGRLCISADITQKKALEEQFLRVQRMENLGMLAAGIAHDLNNILAPMRMVGPLLRDRLTEPRDLRLLDTLETCASRGAGLVRQVLGFAQGVSGEHRLVQVKHLLRDVVDVIAASFPKSIVLEDEIPSDLWPVNGNPTQIHQILLNLCVNARDAMPQGGVLRLRGENRLLSPEEAAEIEGAQPGAWLVIHVEDTGTGIPPDVLPRIWEPLFTTKAPDKGTGLGLSTVRGIVAQHRGFVTVQTEPGRGTTFRVHLPVDESAVGPASPASAKAAAPARGELILFVDDEPSICDVATAVLTRHGYRVLTAHDGAEAVAQFAPRIAEIALVVTDLDMPNLDGGALCRVIRTLSPTTKIAAISGFANSAPIGTAVNGFLPKPFSPDNLLAVVEQVLQA